MRRYRQGLREMNPIDPWEKQRDREYRELRKGRPTCKAKRPQTVAGKATKGEPAPAPVTMNLTCGKLLDKTGKCWFCGHIDRAVRKAYRESLKEDRDA